MILSWKNHKITLSVRTNSGGTILNLFFFGELTLWILHEDQVFIIPPFSLRQNENLRLIQKRKKNKNKASFVKYEESPNGPFETTRTKQD